MIKRINLVAKKPFLITYSKILQIGLLFLLLASLIIGYQFFNAYRLEKILHDSQQALKIEENKRDEYMKKPQRKKISVGQYQELFDKINSVPHWTSLISDITQRLPNTVWLTSFKTSQGNSELAKPKKTKSKDDKPTHPLWKLELTGMSTSLSPVTNFSSKLSLSEYLSNIKVDTQEQTYGYSFVIMGNIKNVRY
jgi:Tfp pilus assembly protein PilN